MSLSLPTLKVSGWKLETFGSGGISVGFVAAGGGRILLKDPTGIYQTFNYGGVGAGVSEGIKIPKLGRIQIPSPKGPITGSVGPMSFPTKGTVFARTDLAGNDLTKNDIQGVCMFAEAGGGIIGGGSGTVMLIGMNPLLLPLMAINIFGIFKLINSATGIILMGGLNVGIQAQVGATSSLGYLR